MFIGAMSVDSLCLKILSLLLMNLGLLESSAALKIQKVVSSQQILAQKILCVCVSVACLYSCEIGIRLLCLFCLLMVNSLD